MVAGAVPAVRRGENGQSFSTLGPRRIPARDRGRRLRRGHTPDTGSTPATSSRADPARFERLAQRLLREAGFRNVEVLGKSGDGGIDGVGVYRVSLVSFPVYFQCNRWSNQVGAGAVTDSCGAMTVRGEKGLLLATATFSPAAREEATRDGAPPVDLISGEDLCGLLKDHGLGVKTTERMIEDIEVVKEFFDEV